MGDNVSFRQLRVSSISDMAIVDVGTRKVTEEVNMRPARRPRRSNSEPPGRGERFFFGSIRFCSLREKRNNSKPRVPRFRVSMVSIPSSYEFRRSVRKRRRHYLQEKKDQENSARSSSGYSVPSEPRLKADMNDSGEEIPPILRDQTSVDFGDIDDRISPSRKAILVNGSSHSNRPHPTSSISSVSSSFEVQKNFEIERLQLSSPPGDNPAGGPDNWNLKDSYKKDLEYYINSSTISNPWADPFEEDKRSRTEQWVESVTPGRQEDSDELPEELPPLAVQSDPLGDTEESLSELPAPTSPEESSSSQETKNLKGAEVEIVWQERPVSQEDVLHDVIIKLNGEPTKSRQQNIPHIQAQESLELPPSEISFVSSTIDKNSLVKQNYRNNLRSALEHSGDSVSLNQIERFWNYQYTSQEDNERDEKRRRKELERMRGHTPTMERVVMYYTSDKRPSLFTISPSPVPSPGRSNSSFSEAYRLFNWKSATPSPRPPKLSRHSFESEELNISIEKDNLAEEITIEVPQLLNSFNNTTDSFFHLDRTSSDEDDAGGRVEVPNAKSPPARLFLSPHPRLRVSRATSTKDLHSGSAEGRSDVPTHPEQKQYQSKPTQTMDAASQHNLQPLPMLSPDGSISSERSSPSIDDLLLVDFRASSCSPSKNVHFAQKIDASVHTLPKHQRGPLLRSPKSILKRIDSKATEIRRLLQQAADAIYKDLRMLVEERDRCLQALEMLPPDNLELIMSQHTAQYQTNYRDKLIENKGVLDAKIDHFWKKLNGEMPLSDAQGAFVYGVEDSKLLTLNMQRKVIPSRYVAAQTLNLERRSKTNLEMASDYARKLADMRKAMIRRDSDIVQEDEKSVEEILKRVSTSLANLRGT